MEIDVTPAIPGTACQPPDGRPPGRAFRGRPSGEGPRASDRISVPDSRFPCEFVNISSMTTVTRE
jgi:hypothetical protein